MKQSQKPKYRFDIIQNSEEWYAIKLGMFSASSGDALLMDRTSKGYQNLINRITEERFTGEPCENGFKGNSFTERGHLFEPIAADNYEIENFCTLKEVGVVIMDEWTLSSPDRLIDDDGLVQIKNPIFSTQRAYLQKLKKLTEKGDDIIKVIPSNYYKQMNFELMTTGRDYNVFYSFHPNLRSIKIVLHRDEELINTIRLRLKEAIEIVEFNINELK